MRTTVWASGGHKRRLESGHRALACHAWCGRMWVPGLWEGDGRGVIGHAATMVQQSSTGLGCSSEHTELPLPCVLRLGG